MSNTTWVALTGFGGSVVVGVVAVWTTRSAQRGENARARANFQQQLNIERGKRLRELYEPFVALHLDLRRVVGEQTVLFEGETIAQRNERHRQVLQKVSIRTMDAYAAVEVDPDTQEVKKLLNEASNEGYSLFSKSAGSDSIPITTSDQEKLAQLVTKVHDAITRQLAELTVPVDVEAPKGFIGKIIGDHP